MTPPKTNPKNDRVKRDYPSRLRRFMINPATSILWKSRSAATLAGEVRKGRFPLASTT
jgi:hypothetical protein